MKHIKANEVFQLENDIGGIKVEVEWRSHHSGLADLDVYVLLYDENSRFIEKLTIDHAVSSDGAFRLEADMDVCADSKVHKECVYANFGLVSVKTCAAVLFVDGGPRNFQFIKTVAVCCSEEKFDLSDASGDMMRKLESTLNTQRQDFFRAECTSRKDFQGIAAMVLYKDGWHCNDSPKFCCCPTLESVYLSTTREKDEYCQSIAVNTVPCLHKYRPRLFPTVKSICAALSSKSLPKLKKSFLAGKGLPKQKFTEVLFRQLFESKPDLANTSEASYTVAMLHEMFGQIDFNGDGAVDWDEFTTFCIHTGLISSHDNAGSGGEGDSHVGAQLNTYNVEYKEDSVIKDTVLSTYAPLSILRHAPAIKRLLVLQEKKECCLMLDEQFNLITTLHPSKILGVDDKEERYKIYDVCYIPHKDMYAVLASDHSLTVYREHMARIKIVYSALNNILCTIDCNNTIYGWRLDSKESIFEISRHKGLITDIIAIDNHNLFATCSLDRRVVLWSQTTRRVKGVLLGHNRGITRMSCAKDTLLTSGFECEARTWDLNLREQLLVLKGHRLPIADSKVMCDNLSVDSDLRAVTVDDSGEFRLWNIGVTEINDNNTATTLQIFTLKGNDKLHTKFSFIVLPFEPRYSKPNYSNIIAGASKLYHFRPEKNISEFVPPNCMLYSESNACLLTGVGKSIYKYDIYTGGFQNSFDNVDNSEITCLLNDGKEGRRLYVGFASGNIVLVNISSGQILARAKAHTKSVTAMTLRHDDSSSMLYVGSADGKLRTLVEHAGNLTCHSYLDESFRKQQNAINTICIVPEVKLLLMSNSATTWGGWNCVTLKTIFNITEVEPISAMEVIGGGGAYNRGGIVDFDAALQMEFEKIITIAVCTSTFIRIYTVDPLNIKAVCSHSLMHSERLYFSRMIALTYPQKVSMNYSGKLSDKLKEMIVASSDEGKIVAWDIRDIREDSVCKFYDTHPTLLELAKMLIPHPENRSGVISRLQSRRQLRQGSKCASRGDSSLLELESLAEHVDEDKSVAGSVNSFDSCHSSRSQDDSVKSEQSQESLGSLFSMTSKMGVIVDDIGETANTVGIAKTLSIVSPIVTKSSGEEKRCSPTMEQKDAAPKRKHLHRMDTVSNAVGNYDVLPSIETSTKIMTAVSWVAHTDTIQSMVALREDACIITNSLDGFHRVWNLHQECLGEMALPNLTEAMQIQLKESKQAWKFILEKIPVLPHHQKVATQLIKEITGVGNDQYSAIKSRRAAGSGIDNRKHAKVFKEMTRQDKQRTALLASMSGSSSMDDKSSLKPDDGVRARNAGILADDSSIGMDELSANKSEVLPRNSVNFYIETKNEATKKTPLIKSDSMSTLQTSKNLISARNHKKRQKTKSQFDKKLASVFGEEILWNDPQDFVANKVTAFSESSISDSHHQGYIDEEGHSILRRLQKDRSKLEAYEKSEPLLMLKNIGMCTSIEYPSSDMSNSELSFGKQKSMYKNANVVISEKAKLSDRAKQNARHALAKARIKNCAGSVGKLVHYSEKPIASLQLPSISDKDDTDQPVLHSLDAGRQNKRRMAVSLPDPKLIGSQPQSLSGSSNATSEMTSPPPKKLDHMRLSRYIGKVMDADDGVTTQWEKDLEVRQKRNKNEKQREKKRRNRRKPAAKKHTMVSTERRLGTTIKHFFAVRGQLNDHEKEARMPTAKDLLPSYTIADVKNFLDTFQRVDVDMSGTLDADEWVEFLSGDANNTISRQQARRLFNNVDMSSQGLLSVKDLVPIVFSKADKHQQEIITHYLEEQIAKGGLKGKEGVTTGEMEALFEAYDTEHIGYISVRFLRDKLKGLRLPVTAVAGIAETIQDFEDDELLNVSEFLRVFHTFICEI